MDIYDEDIETEASRFMKDLSLFEVPSRDHFHPSSTTPKRYETSADQEFEKKRDMYANLYENCRPYAAYATSSQSPALQQPAYGKILTKVNVNGHPGASASGGMELSNSCEAASASSRSGSRPVGAIESFLVSGTDSKPKEPCTYAKIDRASVIAASRFATPKNPTNQALSEDYILTANNQYHQAPLNTYSGGVSIPHSTMSADLSSTKVDSSTSSPRSSLSSSSRESQHSSSPCASASPIYENLQSVHAIKSMCRPLEPQSKKITTGEGDTNFVPMLLSVAANTKHSSLKSAVAHSAAHHYVGNSGDPPPYVHPPPEHPIYANLQEINDGTSTHTVNEVYHNTTESTQTPTSVIHPKDSATYSTVYSTKVNNTTGVSHSIEVGHYGYTSSQIKSDTYHPVDETGSNQGFGHGNQAYLVGLKANVSTVPKQLEEISYPQTSNAGGKYVSNFQDDLPPPPPYPGIKGNVNMNSKTLLPYNVTPPRTKGPSEAEKKIEALMKEIEDEMENNPPEGDYFGRLFLFYLKKIQK